MGGSELTGARGMGEERETETEARGGRHRHCSCCRRETRDCLTASGPLLSAQDGRMGGWIR